MVIHAARAHLDELLERIPDAIDFDVDEDSSCRDLGDWLERTLRKELGLACVARDDDGAIPVPLGDNVVYIHQGDADAEFVTVSALLAEGFEPSVEVYEAVNAINLHTPMAKTVFEADQVFTTVDLPIIDTLSPDDLMLAIDIVGGVVERFGPRLQTRFVA